MVVLSSLMTETAVPSAYPNKAQVAMTRELDKAACVMEIFLPANIKLSISR